MSQLIRHSNFSWLDFNFISKEKLGAHGYLSLPYYLDFLKT